MWELNVPSKKRKELPSDLVEEISEKRKERPPVNQAQSLMHDPEIEKERKRILEELEKSKG